MSLLVTLAVVAFVVAQFTPRGQAFLSTDRGALATVAVAAVAILAMLPGLMMGNVLDLIFAAIWCWVAYPRLGAASRGARALLGPRR